MKDSFSRAVLGFACSIAWFACAPRFASAGADGACCVPGAPCPADISPAGGDGAVGVPDLLMLLGCWGPVSSGCEPADFSPSGGDGAVGVSDLLHLLVNWGDCHGSDGPTCSALDEAVCAAAGGTWLGEGTLCEKSSCESPLCPPNAGDCCVPNGSPGCDQPECCAAVCGSDPFCCETEWDELCVEAGFFESACFCGDPACGFGDCCTANDGPGCENPACCDAVCADDPFCCNALWDGKCATIASGFSVCDCALTGPCSPSAGNCCNENGSIGCDDPDCCGAVCDEDPFCCSVTWDLVCVQNAMFNEMCDCEP